MIISEVTAVTTTDLTGSVGLVSWGAATHITGTMTHCHAQIGTSEKPFLNDKYRRAKKLAYRGTAGSSTGTVVSAGSCFRLRYKMLANPSLVLNSQRRTHQIRLPQQGSRLETLGFEAADDRDTRMFAAPSAPRSARSVRRTAPAIR